MTDWSLGVEIRVIKCRRDDKLEENCETWRALLSNFMTTEAPDDQTVVTESSSSGSEEVEEAI